MEGGHQLTVVVGGWTVVLEEQQQAAAAEGDGRTTLKVSVRTAKGRPALPAAQVVFSQVADDAPSPSPQGSASSGSAREEGTNSSDDVPSGVEEEEETGASLRPADSTTQGREDDENTATLHIDDLPQEVQQHILSYLGPTDLLLRVGVVSQYWRRLTEDAALWRSLHAKLFGGPPVSVSKLRMSGRAPVSWFHSCRYLYKEQLQAQREHQRAVNSKRDALMVALIQEDQSHEQRKRALESSYDVILNSLNRQYAHSTLRHACKYGSIVVVRKILADSSVHIDTPLNYRSQTALMVAARYGQLEVVRHLMDSGARIHGQELLLAIEKGHEEVVRLLLARGVDANEGPNLARAVLRNNVPIARLLLEHGARQSINVVGLYGAKDPPLHVAVSKSYHEMVKLLLAHGADPRLQSRDRQTAVSLAQGNRVILATLLEHEQQQQASAPDS